MAVAVAVPVTSLPAVPAAARMAFVPAAARMAIAKVPL